MRKSIFFLFLIIPAFLFGEGQKESKNSVNPEDQIVYIINNIDVEIVEGLTKPFAIPHAAKIRKGTLLQGFKNLETYIEEKKQLLISLRTFEELTFEYSLGELNEHNQIPVNIFISVTDSSNFIMYPAPKYDSNEGLELELSGHDYNFLGTLTPIEFDVGYKRDTEGNNGFFLESDINLPFEFGGYIWTLDFANNLDFLQHSKTYYGNDIGVVLDLPYKESTLSFGLYESIYVNEENDERYKAAEGEFFRDVWYLNTTALARWNLPTNIDVFGLGKLHYTPELDFGVNYRPGGDIGDSRRGFEISLNQKLDFGSVNWDGNFRKGLMADAQLINTYNLHFGTWDNQFFVTGIYHKIFTDYTAFSGRIRYAQWFDNYHDKAGDVIRGVLDESLAADFMLSINLQESFRLFRFEPSKIFHNPKLRIFDFEEQIVPFIDIALVQDPKHHRSFSFDDIITTAGLEFITYPDYFQSSYLRVSFGVNVKEMMKQGLDVLTDSNNREIYIGMGHYF
jgi:hypothetical protein